MGNKPVVSIVMGSASKCRVRLRTITPKWCASAPYKNCCRLY